MKKFNIESEHLAIIAFITIQILCVSVASYCALHDDAYQNTSLTIMFLSLTLLCEWVKYKITHPNDITQG